MIAELYQNDTTLVNNFISNDITFEIQQKQNAIWRTYITLTNEQIVSESLEITQSILDEEELQIGGCIPSQLKLSVMNISDDLRGKRIVVKIRENYFSETLYPSTNIMPGANLYPYMQPIQTNEYVLFVGEIFSYKRKQNRKVRDIIAFDRLYYGSNVLCKNKLYNYLYQIWNDPAQAGTVIKFSDIAKKFLTWCRIYSPGSSNFINWNLDFEIRDNLISDVLDKKFTALEGLKWICELNGIYLIDDAPASNNLSSIWTYVRVVAPYTDVSNRFDILSYSDLKFDDFTTKQIKYLQFYSYPNGSRWYKVSYSPHEEFSHYISENPLTQALGDSDALKPFVQNFCGDEGFSSDGVNRIFHDVYEYRPFTASIFNRWWVQVGDRVKIPTDDEDIPYVESIVFSRKIKGINSMHVEIEAKGVEVFGKEKDEEING